MLEENNLIHFKIQVNYNSFLIICNQLCPKSQHTCFVSNNSHSLYFPLTVITSRTLRKFNTCFSFELEKSFKINGLKKRASLCNDFNTFKCNIWLLSQLKHLSQMSEQNKESQPQQTYEVSHSLCIVGGLLKSLVFSLHTNLDNRHHIICSGSFCVSMHKLPLTENLLHS